MVLGAASVGSSPPAAAAETNIVLEQAKGAGDRSEVLALETARLVRQQWREREPVLAGKVQALAAHLSAPDARERFLAQIRAHLDAHPEVRTFVPDVDRRLLPPESMPRRESTLVFVSSSLGEGALKSILAFASGRPDVTVVLRGVLPGEDVAQGVKRIQAWAREYDPVPHVELDPTLFRAYGITAVPVTAVVQEATVVGVAVGRRRPPAPEPIAWVRGLASDGWLREEMVKGRRGDLGQQGDLLPIAELDLIAEMQRRFLAVDWETKKENALKRFWHLRDFVTLPSARHDTERLLDPSFVLGRDVTDAAGRVVAAAGTRINPLQQRPFTMAVVVFNPTRPAEIATVERRYRELAPAHSRVVLIATEIDRDRGWQGFQELEERLRAPVFLLTPDWQVAATPSFITADNERHVFRIQEEALAAADLSSHLVPVKKENAP